MSPGIDFGHLFVCLGRLEAELSGHRQVRVLQIWEAKKAPKSDSVPLSFLGFQSGQPYIPHSFELLMGYYIDEDSKTKSWGLVEDKM